VANDVTYTEKPTTLRKRTGKEAIVRIGYKDTIDV
jgi:hypothetical protein